MTALSKAPYVSVVQKATENTTQPSVKNHLESNAKNPRKSNSILKKHLSWALKKVIKKAVYYVIPFSPLLIEVAMMLPYGKLKPYIPYINKKVVS